MNYIIENIGTIIVALVVFCVLFLIIKSQLSTKKKGACGGCSGCSAGKSSSCLSQPIIKK